MEDIETVISPITGDNWVRKLRSIPTAFLQLEYKTKLGVDITPQIRGIADIYEYSCCRSGFRFFVPSSVVGDGSFYNALEKHEWYYQIEKWEFSKALDFVAPGMRLLEVGCGRGDFLKAARENGVVGVGLEMNENAARIARERGLNVENEDLCLHLHRLTDPYDIVAAFQVLEHVPAPVAFLTQALDSLKPGGLLLIAVPDNSEELSENLYVGVNSILNMPPHHQGRWDVRSLAYLPSVLPVDLEHLVCEPVNTSGQRDAYVQVVKKYFLRRLGNKLGLISYVVLKPLISALVGILGHHLRAHSILAVFRKRQSV